LGFLLEGCIGAAGFYLGAVLARRREFAVSYWVIGACGALSVLVFGVFPSRLWRVGSYTQYHYGFALKSYASSAVLVGGLLMSAIVAAAAAYLVFRLRYGERNRR
jgi:hypothetical protein